MVIIYPRLNGRTCHFYIVVHYQTLMRVVIACSQQT